MSANYLLSKGDEGKDVLAYQQRLNFLKPYGLNEDGVYGDQTQAAVMDYQNSNDKLKPSGNIDVMTSNTINEDYNDKYTPDQNNFINDNQDNWTNRSDGRTIDDTRNMKEDDDISVSQFKNPPEEGLHDELIGSAGYVEGAEKSRRFLYEKMNAYNRVMHDIHTGYEFSYVFITRPDLNLFDGNKNKLSKTLYTAGGDGNLTNSADLRYLVEDNIEISRFLDSSVKITNTKDPNFILPMQNLLKEMSSTDVEFSVKSSPANKQGISIDYPTNYMESLAGIPMTLTFSLDRYDTIMKMVHIWTMYMTLIQKGYIRPRMEAIMKNKFESSVAIYQFVTAEDGETIKYWSKAVGAYPQGVPYSDRSHKAKRKITDQDISIPFYAPFFLAMRPSILADFNKVAGRSYTMSDPSPWNGMPISHRNENNYFTDNAAVLKENGRFKLRFFNNDNPTLKSEMNTSDQYASNSIGRAFSNGT